MAKRKITVTVDEELIESIQLVGGESLSSVVNVALGAEMQRRARAAALARQLAEWDRQHGPVSPAWASWAEEVFDDLDGLNASPDVASTTERLATPPPRSKPPRTRRKGAA